MRVDTAGAFDRAVDGGTRDVEQGGALSGGVLASPVQLDEVSRRAGCPEDPLLVRGCILMWLLDRYADPHEAVQPFATWHAPPWGHEIASFFPRADR